MPLQDDLIRQLQSRTEVPAPDQPGSVLTAQQDLTVDWGNQPESDIAEGTVDPNGVVYGFPGKLYIQRGATPALWQNQDGLTAWNALGEASGSALALFGNGADGVINFDGTTTRLGYAPSSGVYTIDRDLYLANGSQISSTAKVTTAGWRIFCTGTFTIGASATLQAPGNDGSGISAGANSQGGNTPTATGFQGGAASNGGAGSTGSGTSLYGFGGNGGAGGANSGGPGTGGGPSGGSVSHTAACATPRNLLTALFQYTIITGGTFTELIAGGGGGGGNSVASSAGGGGAGGGGGLLLCAQHIVNNGSIIAKGGNGANATGSGTGGGGGGGGGGGLVVLVYNSFAGNAATAPLGTGGTAQGAGKNGADGTAGTIITIANA